MLLRLALSGQTHLQIKVGSSFMLPSVASANDGSGTGVPMNFGPSRAIKIAGSQVTLDYGLMAAA